MRTGKDFETISIKMVQYAIKNTLKQKIGKSQQEREPIKKNLMKILELKKKKNEQIKNSAGRVTPTEGTRVPGTPQPLSPQMRPHCDPCSRPLPGHRRLTRHRGRRSRCTCARTLGPRSLHVHPSTYPFYLGQPPPRKREEKKIICTKSFTMVS